MILKGSQRGAGQNLAAHLLRTDENEHVELHDLRGFTGDTLHEAFKEAQAISRGTKCQQYLFSLSLNPPETESVPVETFEAAIERIENKLGLSGQPRAVVFHEKEGRRHAHCVWSRIDAETMTARPLPHFKRKLSDISRRLYLDHDWTMPRGLENPALRDPLNFTLAEWQQAKRAGVDPREIKQAIQNCWAISDGCQTFAHALKERGFVLARGDRRGFVAVDYHGEVYAISRALNLKAKDVRAKLGDPAHLQSVAHAKQQFAESLTPKIKRHIEDARLAFKHKTAALEHSRAVMAGQHKIARDKLDQVQGQRRQNETRNRAARFHSGLRGLWDRVTGHHSRIRKQNEREAHASDNRDKTERQSLIDSQLHERRRLQLNIKDKRKQQAEMLRDLRADIQKLSQLRMNPDTQIHKRQRTQRLRL